MKTTDYSRYMPYADLDEIYGALAPDLHFGMFETVHYGEPGAMHGGTHWIVRTPLPDDVIPEFEGRSVVFVTADFATGANIVSRKYTSPTYGEAFVCAGLHARLTGERSTKMQGFNELSPGIVYFEWRL